MIGETNERSYITEFIEEAKASGLVQRAIQRGGLRGIQVAPSGHHRPVRRSGGGRRGPLRRVRYWTGENAAGSMILFSCVSSMSPPPGGGQAPAARAFSRISARWLRLSYGQMCR